MTNAIKLVCKMRFTAKAMYGPEISLRELRRRNIIAQYIYDTCTNSPTPICG